MTEIATVTIVNHEFPLSGERVPLTVVGNDGEGERLDEMVQDLGGTVIEITAMNVRDVSVLSALWDSEDFAPYRTQVLGADGRLDSKQIAQRLLGPVMQ